MRFDDERVDQRPARGIAADMLRISALTALCLLSACKPPASDEYVTRERIAGAREAPTAPIGSPDTEGALWARSEDGNRLLYGKPGATPLMALACEDGTLRYTRFVSADPYAKAVLALIGNGHVERFWIDAEESEGAWVWRGRTPADDPRLEVLTGPRSVEATVPAGGSITLNASRLPAQFIESCALPLAGQVQEEDPE